MFYYPKTIYNPYPLYRETPMTSYLRVLHASPKSPAVDVYINDIIKSKNLAYGDFSDYIEVMTGNYNVKIYVAGTKTSPVLSKNLFVPPGKVYTVAAIGLLPNIDLLPIPESEIMDTKNMVHIKFAHLSPNAPPVDIALSDGTILFKNVSYKEFTDYIKVPAGTYTLEARPTGTKTTVLYVPNIRLKAGRSYTVYAVGLVNGTPGLQALIPLDGSTYLDL
ncbi:MAG: hypothetical protein ACJAX4_001201 [Clostridium sp.]|jgi:hypothetical protein